MEVEVTIPPILEYNMYMNGVDRSDQLLQCYEVLRKTKKKYWKTLFFHLVDLAAVNSFILYKAHLPAKEAQLISQKQYRETLVQELCCFAEEELSISHGRPPKSTVLAQHQLTIVGCHERQYYDVCKKLKQPCTVCTQDFCVENLICTSVLKKSEIVSSFGTHHWRTPYVHI